MGEALRWYWGDLHNHCNISYGHGSLTHALAVARQQLDFCAVTGHAFWPDLPQDPDNPARLGNIREYHQTGFAKLRSGWTETQRELAAANEPGNFVTFPSYEWHSNADGDHHVLYCGDSGPLLGGDRVWDLKAALKSAAAIGDAPPGLAIPHHIGYPAGYRGINWEAFSPDLSPFVEIFSIHGCSESDSAPYPFLRRMGPRDGRSTGAWGLKQGFRVGLAGSTDHHAAYPGSHGYGRLAAAATALTREALWEAFLTRRLYAATGDRIALDFRLNGAWMGSEVTARNGREIAVSVEGRDSLAYVELLKNEQAMAHWGGPDPGMAEIFAGRQEAIQVRVRVEWGWTSDARPFGWEGHLSLQDGRLLNVETCFAGPSVSSPVEGFEQSDTPAHALLEQNETSCAWRSETLPSPTERHSANQSLILEIEAPLAATLALRINGHRISHTIADLLEGSRAHVLRGWRSEAVLVHRALPVELCRLKESVTDLPQTRGSTLMTSTRTPSSEADCYRVRVAQRNGQWAWSSPIWALR
jgi:hypothetical protein